MKRFCVSLILAVLSATSAAADCGIGNREKVQIGSMSAIKGICLNNKLPITCMYREGEGISCDGPAGGYTGNDLDSLVYSACGCSAEQERELELKRELEGK